jgi:hypothetical protein
VCFQTKPKAETKGQWDCVRGRAALHGLRRRRTCGHRKPIRISSSNLGFRGSGLIHRGLKPGTHSSVNMVKRAQQMNKHPGLKSCSSLFRCQRPGPEWGLKKSRGNCPGASPRGNPCGPLLLLLLCQIAPRKGPEHAGDNPAIPLDPCFRQS